MIKAVFILFVMLSSSARANLHWNPKILKKVDAQYAGSLKLIRKDLVQVITKKVTTTMERTNHPTQFLINKKRIDLRNYRNTRDFANALRKIVPRSDLSASLWINSAHAQLEDLPDSVVPIIQSAITVTAQEESCENFRNFAKGCVQLAHYITDSYLTEMEKEMKNPSSDQVFYKKLTDWHAHLTVLKTNIDQKAVPLLGSGSEQIGKCGCNQLGKCGDPQDDVPSQMKICTEAVDNVVKSAKEEGADLQASAKKIKELVKSVYTNSVPMDGATESQNGIAK